LEFLDATTIKAVEDYAHIGLPTNIESLLLIEVDGRPAIVEEDASRIIEICKAHRALEMKIAQDEQEAMKLKAARRTAFSALARVRPTTILEDVTVPRSEVAPMLEKIQSIARQRDVTFGNFGHAGDGNLHPTCLTDERNGEEIDRAHAAFEEMFNTAIQFGGTITGEHGVGLAKKEFLPLAVGLPALEMMKRIKTSMDPNNVLNPGKIFSLKPRCEGPLPKSQDQVRKFVDKGAWV